MALRGQAFDGDDLRPDRRADRKRAGAGGYAIDMNRAGATLSDAAAVFGSGEAHPLPYCPQQRGIGSDVDIMRRPVDGKVQHQNVFMFKPGFMLHAKTLYINEYIVKSSECT